MSLALDGKVAVVTGGASGVGLGIAQEFADNGARVVITDLQRHQLDEAVETIGPNCWGSVADVTRLADMQAMYQEVNARHGRLDAVVANAGIGAHVPPAEITEEQFDRLSPSTPRASCSRSSPRCLCCRPPHDRDHRLDGLDPTVGRDEYLWRIDGCGTQLHSLLDPGHQRLGHSDEHPQARSGDTDSLRSALAVAQGADHVDAAIKVTGEGNPTGRLAHGCEMGKAAVFLSSDDSSFLTGIELFVDGGMAQV